MRRSSTPLWSGRFLAPRPIDGRLPAGGVCLPPRAPAAVTGGPRRGTGYRASPPSTSSLLRRPLPLAAAFVPLLRFCGRPRSESWRQRRRRQRARARARAAPFTPPASTRLCPAAAPPPAQARAGCSPPHPPPLACFGGHRRGAPARGGGATRRGTRPAAGTGHRRPDRSAASCLLALARPPIPLRFRGRCCSRVIAPFFLVGDASHAARACRTSRDAGSTWRALYIASWTADGRAANALSARWRISRRLRCSELAVCMRLTACTFVFLCLST